MHPSYRAPPSGNNTVQEPHHSARSDVPPRQLRTDDVSGQVAPRTAVPNVEALEVEGEFKPLLPTKDCFVLPAKWDPSNKGSIFFGIGLGGRRGPSDCTPWDALVYVATAEYFRRRMGLEGIVALIADEHAAANDWARLVDIHKLKNTVTADLHTMGQFFEVPEFTTASASDWGRKQKYRDILDKVDPSLPLYFRREAADIQFAAEEHSVIAKIGWSLENGKSDERAFDKVFCEQFPSTPMAFIYTVPGVNDDNAAPRCCPYNMQYAQKRTPLRPGRPAEQPRTRLASVQLEAGCRLIEHLLSLEPTGTLVERIEFIRRRFHE